MDKDDQDDKDDKDDKDNKDDKDDTDNDEDETDGDAEDIKDDEDVVDVVNDDDLPITELVTVAEGVQYLNMTPVLSDLPWTAGEGGVVGGAVLARDVPVGGGPGGHHGSHGYGDKGQQQQH